MFQERYSDCEAPHLQEPPGKWASCLSEFQKLLLLRAIREEKTIFAMRVFVQKNLGTTFAESPPFDLQAAYEDSVCTTPLIFILRCAVISKIYRLGKKGVSIVRGIFTDIVIASLDQNLKKQGMKRNRRVRGNRRRCTCLLRLQPLPPAHVQYTTKASIFANVGSRPMVLQGRNCT